MQALRFHLLRVYVYCVVFFKKLLNDPWTNVSGIYLPVTKDIGFNTLRWILNGEYEAGEIRIVKQKLETDDVVLEIGTGLGFVSVYCAKQIGSDKIFTFEGNPFNVKTAQKVFKKNQVCPVLKNTLLAYEAGVIDFPVDKKSRLASSLLKSKTVTVKVEAQNINQFIAENKPTFLIMDIEGSEYEIFKIMRFQSLRKIQFELHPAILNTSQCNEIFKILADNNFQQDNISQPPNYFFCMNT